MDPPTYLLRLGEHPPVDPPPTKHKGILYRYWRALVQCEYLFCGPQQGGMNSMIS